MKPKVVFLSFRAEPIIEVIPKIKYGMALIRAMVSGVIAKEGKVRCGACHPRDFPARAIMLVVLDMISTRHVWREEHRKEGG